MGQVKFTKNGENNSAQIGEIKSIRFGENNIDIIKLSCGCTFLHIKRPFFYYFSRQLKIKERRALSLK